MQPTISLPPPARSAPPLREEPSQWSSASDVALTFLLRLATIARARREKGGEPDETRD